MIVPRGHTPVSIAGSNVKIAFGAGNLNHLGHIASGVGATRVLVVTDPGIVSAGHPERAIKSLRDAHIHADLFSGVQENPTTEHVSRGVEFASKKRIDLIIGLGGGSSMDCAKGINFILTNGGRMQDYRGKNLAKRPLLPMIAIPTTAGTGSDAQSFALITDPQTHQKMPCGDRTALPRVSILDPDLTATQPRAVAAATGIDAITHAIESSATRPRNDLSRQFSRDSWKLLDAAFETAMQSPQDVSARENMLLGAHLAGAAIENSMLGAAHSLANALTALRGIVHGVAVGMMLPHVIRFNAGDGQNPYADLSDDAGKLAARVESFLEVGGIPRRLGDLKIGAELIDPLAQIASQQWTANFNPRPAGVEDFKTILRGAL
jgi:alcohol dehydrogenase